MNSSLAIPGLGQFGPRGDVSDVRQTRSTFLQLQALVTVVLSYQVLFTPENMVPGQGHLAAVLLLLLTCGAVIVMPDRWIAASWFPGALALSDTVITTGLIYMSGNLSAELYIAYFAILLITTMCRTHKQMTVCFAAVFGLYGIALFREASTSGLQLEHHLLRMPLLLIMAVFYGRTVGFARAVTEHDPLTGLPNRQKFLSLTANSIERARKSRHSLAMLSISLEGFTLISDTLGHNAGDQLLKAVTNRLTDGAGRGHTLSREEGHDFTLLVESVNSPQDCADMAEVILKSLTLPFALVAREIFINAKIGIALFPQDADDAERLLRNAKTAMSGAREHGRTAYQFYSADLHTHAFQQLELAQSLRRAVDREELRIFYQPQVNLSDGRFLGFEALLRWQHPDLGLISPGHFISVAEETGLIVPIGQWTLRRACAQVKEWHNLVGPRFRVAVNLSARQIDETDTVRLIAQTLSDSGLAPRYLEVELTEGLLLQDKASTARTLAALKSLGVQVAIDDFGTGYCSLSYLRHFPIDTLKIDQSFVREAAENAEAKAIVRAIMEMAQALKLKAVAEGVETEEQARFLLAEGCREGQGYLYSRPLPPDEIAQLIMPQSTAHRLPA